MSEAGRSIGYRIGQAALATGAVTAVCVLMALALVVTLVCAPPIKLMAERARHQAP